MQRISITNPQNIIDGTAKKYYFKLRNTGGPKGDKGDKGDTGATGPQGPQGDPCTVVVNSTATLEPGSNAYVTNTGSLSNAVLDFGIPKGDRGPQGAKGDKGDTGAQGETGPRGPQGERGTNATVYVGTTSTLNPGSQATVYNSGSDSNAVLNFGIPQGAKGDTGSQGPQGPAGQNFAPTIVAELPATGDESKLYLTPKAHTTQTATGNPITATITDGAGSMESFQLDGDTFQQSYTGKNLYNVQTKTYNGVTTTVNADGSFNLSGTATAPAYIINETKPISLMENGETYTCWISGVTSLPAGVEIRLGVDNEGSWVRNLMSPMRGSNLSMTFTANTAGGDAIRCEVYTANGTTVDVSGIKVQLEKGSTASSFEPYVGGQPSPSPDYPQTIQTVAGEQTVEVQGKNIINATILQDAWNNNDGVSIVYSSQYVRTVEYTPVNASTTYTLSYLVRGSVVMRGNILQYDSNKSFISSISIANNTTFTTTSTTAFVRFNLFHPDDLVPNDITNLQLELGSTATAYAPYSKQTLPLDLGTIELCKLGAYQDYIWKDGNDWKVHKETASYRITGQESDLEVDIWQTNTTRFFSPRALTATGAAIGGNIALSICNRLPLARNWSTDVVGIYVNEAAFVGRMNKTTIGTTIGEVRSYFANNPTLICYQLATPTDTAITDTTLIAQLEAIRTASLGNGTNTITDTATGSNLAGDMELGYYEYDPTNRYDKWLWLDLNNNYEQIGS